MDAMALGRLVRECTADSRLPNRESVDVVGGRAEVDAEVGSWRGGGSWYGCGGADEGGGE